MPERRIVPRPTLFRWVLASLGVIQTVNGVWATFFPRSFYDDFPAPQGGWVSALGPFDEHLVTDVGSLFLATGVLMLIAAWRLDRSLVAISLGVWLLWAVPHAVWHLFELDAYDTGDAIANGVSVTLSVVAPALLLPLLALEPPSLPAREGAQPATATARIRGVEKPGNPLVRYTYRETKRRFGRVVEPVRLMAHNPSVLMGYGTFEMLSERTHRVDERLKELAVLRAAQIAGCEWCMDFGSALVRTKGVTEDEMRALVDYRNSDVLSEEDKLVVEYAEAMTRTPVDVSDELFERLRARFDEGQLVELTSIVALENYRARFNWALGIESEGFSEGAYCVPPAVAAGAA